MNAVRLGGSNLVCAAATHKSVCKNCKKTFYHTDEHVYHGCCSWGCLCRLREKKQRKKNRQGRKTVLLETEAQALARIRMCEERIAYHTALMNSGALNQKERKTKVGLIWEWRMKLKDAQDILSEIRSEHGQDS